MDMIDPLGNVVKNIAGRCGLLFPMEFFSSADSHFFNCCFLFVGILPALTTSLDFASG